MIDRIMWFQELRESKFGNGFKRFFARRFAHHHAHHHAHPEHSTEEFQAKLEEYTKLKSTETNPNRIITVKITAEQKAFIADMITKIKAKTNLEVTQDAIIYNMIERVLDFQELRNSGGFGRCNSKGFFGRHEDNSQDKMDRLHKLMAEYDNIKDDATHTISVKVTDKQLQFINDKIAKIKDKTNLVISTGAVLHSMLERVIEFKEFRNSDRPGECHRAHSNRSIGRNDSRCDNNEQSRNKPSQELQELLERYNSAIIVE